MADSDVIAMLGEVAAEMRISRHSDMLKKLPRKLRVVVEHELRQPNAEIREKNIEYLAASLPDKYAGSLRNEFGGLDALAEWDAHKLQARKPFVYEQLDESRLEELNAYADDERQRQEEAILSSYAAQIEAAKREDIMASQSRGRKPSKIGLKEMEVRQEIEAKLDKIDIKPRLIEKERELMQDRHNMRMKMNNPLVKE